MNIALVYLLAAAIALVVAAPIALLAPIFFAVSLPMADLAEDYTAPSTVAAEVLSPRTIETAAPFVKVYAARGDVARKTSEGWTMVHGWPLVSPRPTVHAWSTCSVSPAPAFFLGKNGKGLRGAPLAAAKRKASRSQCVSHACPTVSR